ncbi:Iron-binding protein IscA [Methylacidimicrobium cyclopophantes]|uniref:Iron-binding protein IscA n=1 Tax=Methylacidimicrobium cyclopophantes TaxID=1041766 RepID=A0A5E6MGF4_9BACT|nr:iron-sulfur cluster assembly accessory protein [Methylacidimicrobium cyclopophantes]VVM08571.1 Iron-binding protein IscA [Methylacidimicrobium cyclopophantes]
MAIELTEAAANRLRSFLSGHPEGIAFRIGLTRSGCAGWSYVLGKAENISSEDRHFESRGIRLVVSSETLPLLDGLLLDYVRKPFAEGFVFHNPKAKSECGCGQSFSA